MLVLLLSCADPAHPDAPEPARPDPGYDLGPVLDLSEALGPCMDAALADLDGDGDLDVALAFEFHDNVILWNEGGFTFAPEPLPVASPGGGAPGGDSEEVVAVDVDGDGDLDLVFANEDLGGDDELWLWEDGGYVDASDRLPGGGTSNGVAAADLDGDGAIELIFAENGPDTVLTWDGAAFVDVSDAWLPDRPADPSQDVELADVDGDGDLDVVVANEAGNSRLLLNRGDRLEPAPFPTAPAEETRQIAAGDVDGDGDLDLALANVGWGAGPSRDRLLLNRGDGTFEPAPRSATPDDPYETLDAKLVDLDGDGDLDWIRANGDIAYDALVPAPFDAWLNDGAGRFEAAPESVLPRVEGLGLDVEIGDLDGDGDDDLYLCARATRDTVLVRR